MLCPLHGCMQVHGNTVVTHHGGHRLGFETFSSGMDYSATRQMSHQACQAPAAKAPAEPAQHQSPPAQHPQHQRGSPQRGSPQRGSPQRAGGLPQPLKGSGKSALIHPSPGRGRGRGRGRGGTKGGRGRGAPARPVASGPGGKQ